MTKALSQEEIARVFRLGYADPVFFLKFFLRHWFPKDIPWVHLGLVAILTRRTDFLLTYCDEKMLDKIVRHFVWPENPDNDDSATVPMFHVERDEDGVPVRIHLTLAKYTMVMMPRGFSKTTLCLGIVIWWTSYQEFRFPLFVSETQTHAERQLKNVRMQLENNARLQEVFGVLRPEQRSGLSWTDGIIQTTTGITLAARGRGSQVRGFVVDAQRPDVILVDDVEDKESVRTAEQRDKTLEWAYADLIPAMPRMDDNAMMVAVGTLLHTDALLMHWWRDPDWTAVKFGAVDRDGDPLWADNMSAQKIEQTRASYARVGKLNVFYMEFMSQIRNDEEAVFRKQFFIYGKAQEELLKALACDPAISDQPDADFFALACVGMEKGGRHHVLDMWGAKGVHPREQVDRFFAMHKLWMPQKAGVEAIAYQAALVHLLREEMFRQKTYFEIEKIGHGRTKKTDRVEGILAPRFAAGYIVFSQVFPLLETQLLDWPNGKMDFPDVLAMAISLLDPFAALATDPDWDPAEDEFEPLGALGQDIP